MIHPASESPHFAKKKKRRSRVCLFVFRRFACVFYSIPLLVCCACLCPECWSTGNAITHREWSWRWCIRTAKVKQYAVFYLCALLQGGRWRKKKDPSSVLLLFLMFRGETVIVLLTSNSTCSNPAYCHGRARLFQSLLWPSSQSPPLGLKCTFFCAVRVCCESMWRFTFSFFFRSLYSSVVKFTDQALLSAACQHLILTLLFSYVHFPALLRDPPWSPTSTRCCLIAGLTNLHKHR